MSSSIETLDRISASLASTAWAVSWQWAVLVVLLALVVWLVRRSSPTVRYWLWQVLMIKLLVMPIWTLAVLPPVSSNGSNGPPPIALAPRSPSPITADAASIETEMTEPHEAIPSPFPTILPVHVEPITAGEPTIPPPTSGSRLSWTSWLVLVWTCVVLVQIGGVIWQRRRLGRLLAHAEPAGAELDSLVKDLARRIRLRRLPSVVVTPDCSSPFVCGVLRPRLVLPRGLKESIGERVLSLVLLHELGHIRRGDLIWGWIPQIARMIYFFHPFVYWVGQRIKIERELACDQIALSTTGAGAGEYADTLVRIIGGGAFGFRTNGDERKGTNVVTTARE